MPMPVLVVVGRRGPPFGVFDKDIVAFGVKERVLGQVGGTVTVVVLVHQIRLSPERTQSSSFQRFPPLKVFSEAHIPYMYLKLQLSEG